MPGDAVILTQLVQGGRQLHRVVCSGVCPDLLEDIEQLRLRHDVQPKSREVPARGGGGGGGGGGGEGAKYILGRECYRGNAAANI